MIDQNYLKSILIYNPETGIFTWRHRHDADKRWNTRYANKIAGSTDSNGYIQIHINKKLFMAHRLAFLYMTGEHPREFIDHINGIRNDNRWENLRNASHSENQQNQRAAQKDNKSSMLLGVSYMKSHKKWRAEIQHNKFL